MKRDPKIHFISLLSVANDSDLLPYFLPHYNNLSLNRYCLFLHDSDNEALNEECEDMAKGLGWNVRRIQSRSSFNGGGMKAAIYESYRKAMNPMDYLINADADEFQEWAYEPQELVSNNVDVVTGTLQDHFNDSLLPIQYDEELDTQFPLSHPNLSQLLFPKRIRPNIKVIMSKASIPVNFTKCHSVMLPSLEGLYFEDAGCIPRYKWRDKLPEKLKTRSDYDPMEIQTIKNFFEYRK